MCHSSFLTALALAACLSAPNAIGQTFTWSGAGADDNFGTGANWGGSPPSVGSGVVLQFDGNTRPTPFNNYTSGDDFGEWHLLSTASTDFAISGNGFGLHGKIENDAGSGQSFTVNTAGIYARDGSIELNPVGGDLVMGAGVELDNNAILNIYDGGNGNTLTLNGSLSNGNGAGGDGSLVLNQTATVILAADNDYGATTINSGTTLQVGTGATTGTLGSGAVTDNGSLRFNRSDSLTVGNAISGTGSVTVTAGTITFNNQKTYTGGTTLDGGILDLTGGGGSSGAIRGSVTANPGATLRLSTGDATGYNTGAASLTDINLAGGTLHINTASNQTLGGATVTMTGGSITGVANSNLDFFQGTSTINVLASAAASTISGAKINMRQNGGLTVTVENGAAVDDLVVSSVVSNSAGFSNNNLKKAGAGTMVLAGASTYGTATEVLGGTLRVTGTLRSTSGFTVSPGATLELGATNIFVDGHGTAMGDSRLITVNGGTLLMNTAMDSRFGNVTLNDGATWTSNRALDAWDALLANTSAGAATVTVGGTGAATMNGSGGIHLQGVQNFNVGDTTGDAANDLNVTMRLDNPGNAGGAAGGIRKTGAGTMLLSNTGNSFAGDITVAAGTIVTGTATSGGTTGHLGAVNGTRTITVESGAVLDFRANNQFGGGGKAAATIPSIVLDGGTLTSTRFNIVGNVTLNDGATLTQSATDSGNYEGYQFLGTITVGGGSASSVTTGNGKANHLANGTTAFDVADATSDGATDLTVSAPLRNASGDYASGAGSLLKQGAGTMLLAASNTYTGNTTIDAGVLELSPTGKLYNAGFNNSAVVTVNSGGTWRMPDYSYGGVGQLADYAQRRVLAGGTIEVTGDSHSSGQDFTVTSAGGTFRYAATGQTLTLGGNANTNIQLDGTLTFDTLGDISVSGATAILEGTGGLTKTGNATLTLDATNTYSGDTTISGGTLALGTSGSIANSANIIVDSSTTFDVSAVAGGFTLAPGQTISGAGTVGGATIITGSLAPGSSIGTLRFGNDLTLAGTSDFEIDAATDTADLAIAAAALVFGGDLNVTNIGGTLAGGQSFNLFDFDSGQASGAFTNINLPDPGAGLGWDDSALYTTGTIVVIPESSAILLAALGALGLLVRRR